MALRYIYSETDGTAAVKSHKLTMLKRRFGNDGATKRTHGSYDGEGAFEVGCSDVGLGDVFDGATGHNTLDA